MHGQIIFTIWHACTGQSAVVVKSCPCWHCLLDSDNRATIVPALSFVALQNLPCEAALAGLGFALCLLWSSRCACYLPDLVLLEPAALHALLIPLPSIATDLQVSQEVGNKVVGRTISFWRLRRPCFDFNLASHNNVTWPIWAASIWRIWNVNLSRAATVIRSIVALANLVRTRLW